MNRRTFVRSSVGASMVGISGRAVGKAGFSGDLPGGARTLAGMSFQELRDRLRNELFDEFIPLMSHYVIDPVNGGFICNLNEDGSRGDQTKDIVFQGRGIWTYSYLYNNFGRNPEYLEVASNAVRLIMKSKPSREEQIWPGRLSIEGNALAPPPLTIGGDIAIAEGLAEFSRASGERKYWDLAKETLLKCVRIYDRSDYAPDVVALYHGPKPFKFPGARTQGVAMILIGTITHMLATRADPELEATASVCIDAIMNKHFNPEFKLNNELLNHDYSRPTNELAQFVYTGHCIEALSLILLEAARTKDRKLFEAAAERFRRHFEVAWDDVYGGILRSLNNVDQDEWELNKVLWAQEEAMNACLTIIEHTGAEWARDLFSKTYDYVRSRYYLNRWGHSFWISGGDRKVTVRPNLTRVEHYHHPRYLMYSILALDRMIRRGGEAARQFPWAVESEASGG